MTKLRSSLHNRFEWTERRQRGFTLTELAVVVAIVALLIGGTLMTLAAQSAAREVSDTQRTLDLAREAIMGFAIRYGRLPCPAAPTGTPAFRDGTATNVGGTGEEAFASGGSSANGQCFNSQGFLPALTLGIAPTDQQGFLIDAWLSQIRYAVSQANSVTPPVTRVFTTAGGMKQIVLVSPPVVPDLVVCTTSAGATPNAPPTLPACGAGVGSFQTAAVLVSIGKNRAVPGNGTDEQENTNGDRVFVSRTPSPAGSTAEFDDIVVWLSSNVLYNRLIAAGAI